MKEHEEKVEAQTQERETLQETEPVEETETAESTEAVTEEAEESVEEESSNEEPTGDKPLDDDALEQIGNLKKHDAALLLITKTKHIVNDTEKQLDACKLLLEEDLKSYQDAKASLKENALDESEILLNEVGYKSGEEDEAEEDTVVFEP
ncbi:MAG: hypothetical protein L3J47_09665, partial [Sulfurovum sp.]|nr:hypothetical protein [Sulfurovum sp.]